MARLDGLRVMLVEDEGLVLMLEEEFLIDLGCEIAVTASRLEDALVKAEAAAVDVAILDVNLAGKLSYPVAAVLQSRRIPFVFATGYGSPAVPPEFQKAPVLSKPFKQGQLADAILLARQ